MNSRRASESIVESHPLLVIPENRLALAAALRLVREETRSLAPLVCLYGPSGVGKSHIVRQTILDYRRLEPAHLVISTLATAFAAELAEASAAKHIPAFQKKYRAVKFLIVEDVQSLAGRTESISQLTATIDEVLKRDGAVLVTARQSPGQWRNLSARLANRCHGGTCIEVRKPGRDSRQELVRHFCRAVGVNEHDVWQQVERLDATPRQLLGIVQQTRARLAGPQGGSARNSIARVVEEHHPADEQPVSMAEIARIVGQELGVAVAELKSEVRTQRIALARQMAMYASREIGCQSCEDIGKFFGGRNHSTVVHACQRVAKLLGHDPEFAVHYLRVKERLPRRGQPR